MGKCGITEKNKSKDILRGNGFAWSGAVAMTRLASSWEHVLGGKVPHRGGPGSGQGHRDAGKAVTPASNHAIPWRWSMHAQFIVAALHVSSVSLHSTGTSAFKTKAGKKSIPSDSANVNSWVKLLKTSCHRMSLIRVPEHPALRYQGKKTKKVTFC